MLVVLSLQFCLVKSTNKLVTEKPPSFVALASITSMRLMLGKKILKFPSREKGRGNPLKCTNFFILRPTFRRGCWTSLICGYIEPFLSHVIENIQLQLTQRKYSSSSKLSSFPLEESKYILPGIRPTEEAKQYKDTGKIQNLLVDSH